MTAPAWIPMDPEDLDRIPPEDLDVCPECQGAGVVCTGFDPDSGLHWSDDCPMCEGTGELGVAA